MTRSRQRRPASREDYLRNHKHLESGRGKIATAFQLLRENKRRWVGMPVIMRVAKMGPVATYMSTLRQMGCVIENRLATEPARNGAGYERHSFYRLLKEPREFAKGL
jgi:hypothetical protein